MTYTSYLPAGLHKSAAMPVLHLLSGPKIVFCGPLPRAKFYVYRGRNVEYSPQNYQIFAFWP